MIEVGTGLEVRGFLLPLEDDLLLLPNRTVVEIIGYRDPEPLEKEMPDWYLGNISWQHVRIPLVSFDRPESGEKKRRYRSRIAICYTLNGNPNLPYIGILLSAIPQLARATEETVRLSERPEVPGDFKSQQLRINGREAWIPDLDALERAITEH